MKRWTQIFKALGNINRLKIIKLLSRSQAMAVSEVAREIKVSVKGTSKHLIILHNLDVLESVGRGGHVYYSVNAEMPSDLRKIIDMFL